MNTSCCRPKACTSPFASNFAVSVQKAGSTSSFVQGWSGSRMPAQRTASLSAALSLPRPTRPSRAHVTARGNISKVNGGAAELVHKGNAAATRRKAPLPEEYCQGIFEVRLEESSACSIRAWNPSRCARCLASTFLECHGAAWASQPSVIDCRSSTHTERRQQRQRRSCRCSGALQVRGCERPRWTRQLHRGGRRGGIPLRAPSTSIATNIGCSGICLRVRGCASSRDAVELDIFFPIMVFSNKRCVL